MPLPANSIQLSEDFFLFVFKYGINEDSEFFTGIIEIKYLPQTNAGATLFYYGKHAMGKQ